MPAALEQRGGEGAEGERAERPHVEAARAEAPHLESESESERAQAPHLESERSQGESAEAERHSGSEAESGDDRGSDDLASDDHSHDGMSDDSADGRVESTLYEDRDGMLTATVHLEVATSDSTRLDTAQFTFAKDGTISAMLEGRVAKDGTLTFRAERLDANETVSTLTIEGKAYVLKQEAEFGQIEFSLYRDDNLDGIWTEVMEGHVAGTPADVVALVGSTPLLAQAAGIVG